MHAWLHWWGPAILALYTGVIPWVMAYPSRYYDQVSYSTIPRRPEQIDENARMPVYKWFAWWSLPIWYLLWWAMPHVGTEILLLICVFPLFVIYLMLAVGIHALDGFFNFVDEDDKAKRKATGMSIAEWEVKKYEERRRADQAIMRAFNESEAAFRGEDIRKDRFRVYDGTGGARE